MTGPHSLQQSARIMAAVERDLFAAARSTPAMQFMIRNSEAIDAIMADWRAEQAAEAAMERAGL